MEKSEFYQYAFEKIVQAAGVSGLTYKSCERRFQGSSQWTGLHSWFDLLYKSSTKDGLFDRKVFDEGVKAATPELRLAWGNLVKQEESLANIGKLFTSKELIVSLGVAGAVMAAVIGTGYWTYKRHKKATQTQTWEHYIRADASAKSELER